MNILVELLRYIYLIVMLVIIKNEFSISILCSSISSTYTNSCQRSRQRVTG